jgi:hypothetical protein
MTLICRLIIRDSVRLRQSQLLDWKNSPASREGMSANLSDKHPFLRAALDSQLARLQKSSRENFAVRAIAIADQIA